MPCSRGKHTCNWQTHQQCVANRSAAEEPPKDAAPQPCDALQQLLVLESRQQGVDGGRPSGGSACT